MMHMKFSQWFLIPLILLVVAGCAMNAAMDDLYNNKYLSVEPYPNSDTTYVGAWTTNMIGGLVCIKINQDGTAKYCQNKMNGTIEKIYAKVYKDGDDLYLINEVGVRYKINDYSNEYINTTAYGSKFKFIPGIKSLNCEEFLQN